MTHESQLARFPFIDPADLRRAAVICHRNADADSYLSAYALSALLKSLSRECSVDLVTPGGMTTLTAKLSEKFPYPLPREGEDYDLLIAVDVGDAELLKDWLPKFRTSKGVRVLVDHHPFKETGLYDHAVVDENATSAAEVVYALFKAKGKKTDPQVAQALLEALMFDSSHLAIAGEDGLRAAVELVDAGANLAEARRDLRSEPDNGEVLAKLKGAQRLKIYRAGRWVVTASKVGSFQAHVARAMTFMGADVAVVCGETDDETRVSLRATQRFHESTGIHLGTQVAEPLGAKTGGHGGGHATAASYSCRVGEDRAMEETLSAVGRLIGAELSEVH